MRLPANRGLAILGASLAVVAGAVAALLPVYSSGGGSETIAAVNGDWVFALLAALVLLAVAPIFSRGPASRWVAIGSGSALVAGSLVTVVGVFFLPSGVALLAAGLVPASRGARSVAQ